MERREGKGEKGGRARTEQEEEKKKDVGAVVSVVSKIATTLRLFQIAFPVPYSRAAADAASALRGGRRAGALRRVAGTRGCRPREAQIQQGSKRKTPFPSATIRGAMGPGVCRARRCLRLPALPMIEGQLPREASGHSCPMHSLAIVDQSSGASCLMAMHGSCIHRASPCPANSLSPCCPITCDLHV